MSEADTTKGKATPCWAELPSGDWCDKPQGHNPPHRHDFDADPGDTRTGTATWWDPPKKVRLG